MALLLDRRPFVIRRLRYRSSRRAVKAEVSFVRNTSLSTLSLSPSLGTTGRAAIACVMNLLLFLLRKGPAFNWAL